MLRSSGSVSCWIRAISLSTISIMRSAMSSSLNLIMWCLKKWREFLIVILGCLCYYFYSQPANVSPPQTKTEYITKVKTEKEFIRITEPSGRIVEKTVDRVVNTDKKETAKVYPQPADKPTWSVGAMYDFRNKAYQAEVSRRLGSSPISVTAGVSAPAHDPKSGVSLLIGARIDW